MNERCLNERAQDSSAGRVSGHSSVPFGTRSIIPCRLVEQHISCVPLPSSRSASPGRAGHKKKRVAHHGEHEHSKAKGVPHCTHCGGDGGIRVTGAFASSSGCNMYCEIPPRACSDMSNHSGSSNLIHSILTTHLLTNHSQCLLVSHLVGHSYRVLIF